MRYPNSIWEPGPRDKQNGGINTCKGVVCHSMVGPYAAALGELQKPTRRASWHYSVLKDGRVFCHYEDELQAWHAGSAYNNSTIGIEHEGGYDPHNEPLTERQRDASVALVRWLAQAHHFPLVRHVGLWEHNEVSGAPTACPSNRIPWPYYTAAPAPPPVAEEEEDMKPYLAWCPDRAALYLIGPQGARRIIAPAVGDQLAKDLGPVKVAYSSVTLDAMNVPPRA